MTLAGYVTRRRIAYAKYLLRTTGRNIAEIATECGFFDQSHFTRTFGRLEGLSPLKYRVRSMGRNGQSLCGIDSAARPRYLYAITVILPPARPGRQRMGSRRSRVREP